MFQVKSSIESLFLTFSLLVILSFCILYLQVNRVSMMLRSEALKLELETSSKAKYFIPPVVHRKEIKLVTQVLKTNIKISKKLILIYSTLFDQTIWPDLGLEEIKTFMQRCEYKNCEITYDKSSVNSADALLFHGVDVMNNKEFSPSILYKVALQKKNHQKWVFFIQESPDNYADFSAYAGLFDWLMSYKYTSDILVPYGHYKDLDVWDKIPNTEIDYAASKSKLAVWFVSNCGHTRDTYIKELRKYLPITVGGKCAQGIFNESTSCERGTEKCIEEITKHKFVFAFENSFCDYYVTEKYWHKGIDLGLVPVVMGARYNKNNVIPGSYIDASKFRTIKKLAEYLLYLNDNDGEYNKYFAWKKKFKRIGYEKMCQLCETLHTKGHLTNKPHKNIWSQKNDCSKFQWKIEYMKTLIKRSQTTQNANN